MKVVLASDHAGYVLRTNIYSNLKLCNSIEKVEELGCYSYRPENFPEYANKLCEFMEKNPDYIGILVCGSGIGMSMAANRFKHIRCALCRDVYDARLSRQHNNANVLALGQRVTGEGSALAIVYEFINTQFEGKHYEIRMNMIS